jgi:hypothetical protein
MEAKNYATATRRWLSLQDSAHYAGTSKRLIELWEKAGHIRVARVITPGHTKGRVLVDRESLDSFIESYIGTPPADIAVVKHNREGEAVGAGR